MIRNLYKLLRTLYLTKFWNRAKKSKPQPKQQAKNFQDIILQRVSLIKFDNFFIKRETFMDNIEAQEDKVKNDLA